MKNLKLLFKIWLAFSIFTITPLPIVGMVLIAAFYKDGYFLDKHFGELKTELANVWSMAQVQFGFTDFYLWAAGFVMLLIMLLFLFCSFKFLQLYRSYRKRNKSRRLSTL